MEPADVKEKVGTWLKQLPNDFRNDSSSSFSSSVVGEPVKGKSTTKATTSDDDVTANGSNEEAIAQESCSWDPMKYDYITPANCKPFFGNFDEDLVDKREQRLCRFYRSNGWCSYQKNWYTSYSVFTSFDSHLFFHISFQPLSPRSNRKL